MKLIKPSFEILEQGPGLGGIYEAIERAGRTCYKSKRPEGQTAKDFVDRMIASKHYAMLEHGTVYLKVPASVVNCSEYETNWSALGRNPYTKVFSDFKDYYFITNYRVIIEHDLQGVLEYLCEPTEHHEKRVTVRFTTDRGVSHEFVRHRVFSFAMESTRYCNYSRDRFNNELTFAIPSWLNLSEGKYDFPMSWDIETTKRISKESGSEKEYYNVQTFISSLRLGEMNYLSLLEDGWTPQQARQILPNALKTELVMTGFVSDYNHFFDLRARGTTGAPHPDAKALAEPLMHEFENRNLI